MQSTSQRLLPKSVDTFTSHLGMIVVLGAMTMLFLTLLVSQSILEARFEVAYAPGGGGAVLNHALANTAILILASLFFEIGRNRLFVLNIHKVIAWHGVTALLVLVFLVSQIGLWDRMRDGGFLPSTDLTSSIFFLLTGIHGLHMVGAAGAMGWLFWKVHTEEDFALLRRWSVNGALLLHFLTILWIVIMIRLFITI